MLAAAMRNPYEPSTPRLAFAVAALAMTAITIGLLVVLPSKMEPESQMFVMLAESGVGKADSADVLARRSCIDGAGAPQSLQQPKG